MAYEKQTASTGQALGELGQSRRKKKGKVEPHSFGERHTVPPGLSAGALPSAFIYRKSEW